MKRTYGTAANDVKLRKEILDALRDPDRGIVGLCWKVDYQVLARMTLLAVNAVARSRGYVVSRSYVPTRCGPMRYRTGRVLESPSGILVHVETTDDSLFRIFIRTEKEGTKTKFVGVDYVWDVELSGKRDPAGITKTCMVPNVLGDTPKDAKRSATPYYDRLADIKTVTVFDDASDGDVSVTFRASTSR